MKDLALRKAVEGRIPEVRPRLEAALKEEGFGILTEIDVAATLKARLGLDRPPYLILGACNPSLAAQALEAEPDLGLLLPCTVVLREEGDKTVILIQDPVATFQGAGLGLDPGLPQEARTRLERALARV